MAQLNMESWRNGIAKDWKSFLWSFHSARSSRVLSAIADFTESMVLSKEANIMKWVLHSCRTRHI